MTTQAYIYISESTEFPGRWCVQVIDGATVYTAEDNLTLEDRDETIEVNKVEFPGAIVSWNE
jgi:hypothetical protein